MASEQQLAILRQGVASWNQWTQKNPEIRLRLDNAELFSADLNKADLCEANLRQAKLSGADLSAAILKHSDLRGSDLAGANLYRADLTSANLKGANLRGANLMGANLRDANLGYADLSEATLIDADLRGTDFKGTDLRGVDFTKALLFRTHFVGQYITETIGLHTCHHFGPSYLSLDTLRASPKLPEIFLKGCGLSDVEIKYYRLSDPSLTADDITDITYDIARLRTNAPIQYQSTFISYSSKDTKFAQKLYNSLQNVGVRCWFAPEDMKMGSKIRDELHKNIHLHERLIIIISEHALNSNWVEDEVDLALRKERELNKIVLFPIRIDKAIFNSQKPWAETVTNRDVGDFSKWRDNACYDVVFNKLLNALKRTDIDELVESVD